MPAFTSIKAKAIGIAVDQGVNMLYDDFDGNLPKVESLINKFAGSGDSIKTATTASIFYKLKSGSAVKLDTVYVVLKNAE